MLSIIVHVSLDTHLDLLSLHLYMIGQRAQEYVKN
jgi:hypothetical protein